MVMIIKRTSGVLILVPQEPIYRFIERHIERKNKPTETKTCIVGKKHEWTEKPTQKQSAKLIIDALKKGKLSETETVYNLPSGFFETYRWRQFTGNTPLGEPYKGKLKIRMIKVNPGAKQAITAIKELEKLEDKKRLNAEKEKIKNTLKKITEENKKPAIYVMAHIHPV